jgi:hypothetical protein
MLKQPLIAIGEPILSREELRDGVLEFARMYKERPIVDNAGGMMIPHMYAIWCMLKKLQPDIVVESGVFKGQSTWVIDQACPAARKICFEPRLHYIVYKSKNAEYYDIDFLDYGEDFSGTRAVAFFDDHQDALPRIKHCKWLGIRELIFDDNYPVDKGDNYSVKKIYSGAGFDRKQRIPSYIRNDIFSKVVRSVFETLHFNPLESVSTAPIKPNMRDWEILQKNLECYFEFPPVFRAKKTRWEEDWDLDRYPTPTPILSDEENREELEVFFSQSHFYTWPCYLRLKQA